MSITLNLAPDVEAKIRLIASSLGRSVEAVVAESLLERFAEHEMDGNEVLSPELWNSRLDQLLANLPHTSAVNLDADRQSIYGDEGR